MEFENFTCLFVDFSRYSFGRIKCILTVIKRARLLAKHVRGSYRIATGLIPDRAFVHIGTIYFNMIFVTTRYHMI